MVTNWRTEFIYESRGRLTKAPLIEALIREGEDIVRANELVQPDNASVIKFREFLNQAREATTPEARREALVGMEALEDKVRAIC